ncbi:DUF3592 domain-containing protein [Catellatospora vulcania]|uniref:DUF3592 domain-containing protein n=1 Tax=Catellatospora vulcania TaxID=1460450 RepID=UPI0012D37EA3|nr:DUF3592 domain-containing protein [Catellatospora vulcania]
MPEVVRWFFVAVLTSLPAVSAAIEGPATLREWRLRLSGQTVVGKVTGISRFGNYGCRGTVRYTVARGRHTVSGHIDPRTTVGQEYTVRYLPSKPQVAVLSEGVFMLLFKTLAIIGLTAMAIWLWSMALAS